MAATNRVTRGLYLTFSLMCVVSFANSAGVKDLVKEMKEQLEELEKVIELGKAKIESERRNVFEVMDGNIARVKCIREHSSASASEIKFAEDLTENTNAHVKETFANMAAKVQELESRLEDMKANVRYLEHFSTDPGQVMF